jgi:hypothetical protein
MEKIKEVKEQIIEKHTIIVRLNEKEINEALVIYSINKLKLDNIFSGNFTNIGRKESVDDYGSQCSALFAEVELIKRSEIV